MVCFCFCEDDKDESSATFVCSGLGGGVGARLSSICAPDVYVDHQASVWPPIHIGILFFSSSALRKNMAS